VFCCRRRSTCHFAPNADCSSSANTRHSRRSFRLAEFMHVDLNDRQCMALVDTRSIWRSSDVALQKTRGTLAHFRSPPPPPRHTFRCLTRARECVSMRRMMLCCGCCGCSVSGIESKAENDAAQRMGVPRLR
jgi:hypothetical protein